MPGKRTEPDRPKVKAIVQGSAKLVEGGGIYQADLTFCCPDL